MGKIRNLSKHRFSAEDWTDKAREFLIKEGIAGVNVEPIARALGVTPGSFYWHFKNRSYLHKALLRDWLRTNVDPFLSIYSNAAEEPREQYLALAYVWLLDPNFNPMLDFAIREWARTEPTVSRLLRFVDEKRLKLYIDLFGLFGHESNAALVRARTMYYHQIGYYAMRVEDALENRLVLVPYYAELFTGDNWLSEYKDPETIRRILENYKRKG